MPCERYREAVADLAAAGGGTPELGRHVEACPGCRRELERLRAALAIVDATLGSLATAEPSPAFRPRLLQLVAKGGARPPFWWRSWGAAVAATCVALLGATLWWGSWAGKPHLEPTVAPTLAPAPLDSEALTTDSELVAAAGAPLGSRQIPARAPAAPLARLGEFEVLVPAGEEQLLLRLVATVRQQKVGPPALLHALRQTSLDDPDPAAIEIVPLEIVPLDPAEALGT